MSDPLLATAGLLLLALSAYGWGWATGRACLAAERLTPAFAMALGLSAWSLAGGVLNALGLANRTGLWLLLIAGVCAGLVAIATMWRRDERGAAQMFRQWRSLPGVWLEAGVPTLIVVAVLVFSAAALLPASAFNHHDDFHTYFARAFRMLAGGAVGGDPFSLLGIDSLGAQSLFHATTLLFWPASHLNGFDGVFCLALAAALSAELVLLSGGRGWLVVAAPVVLLLESPQTANISAAYSAAAAVLALLIASRYGCDDGACAHPGGVWLRMVPMGLLLSLLVALKLPFAGFAALFCIAWFVLFCGGERAHRLHRALAPSMLGVGFLLPWVVPVWPKYRAMIANAAQSDGGDSYLSLRAASDWAWSAQPLFLGGSQLAYHAVAGLGLLAAGVLAVWMVRHRTVPDGIAAGVVAGGLAIALSYRLNWAVFDQEHAIRYACPYLLAAAPLALAGIGWLAARRGKGGLSVMLAGLLPVMLVTGIGFGADAVKRVDRMWTSGSVLSYPVTPGTIGYTRLVFQGPGRSNLGIIQRATEPGTTILAVVSQPFYLDFSRNRIFSASMPSTVSHPWLSMPADDDPEALRRYLLSMGVRYIAWETSGPGMRGTGELMQIYRNAPPFMRRPVERFMRFLSGLNGLGKAGYMVMRQHNLALFDLKAQPFAGRGPEPRG